MRVRTDVAALPKTFDYAVPEQWDHAVTVGSRVRILLHGRRVGGWVVEDDVTPPEGIAPQPLALWSGWGPPPAVVALAEWAAWRWAGPASFFLRAASPEKAVRALPVPPPIRPGPPTPATPLGGLAQRVAGAGEPALLRLAPSTDLLDLVLAVLNDPATSTRPGSVLVLVPSVGWAERLTDRLVRRGVAATTDWAEARSGWPVVVGSRAAAWSPLPQLAAAVVLDAHDESYREESAPTYNAVETVAERARREGALCVLTSPAPPVALSAGRSVVALPPAAEKAGWATLQCVDRRGADPHEGLFSPEFVRLARAVLDDAAQLAERGPLVCVFNRIGRARLLACVRCGELAQCTRCGAAVRQVEGGLRCPRCEEERPLVCAACGGLRLKTLRVGVSRLREEVAALLGAEVAEVSGAVEAGATNGAPVLMGTEAVLHRVRRASAVVFLDIDLHLLAPRFSATDETVALLARSSRLVGPRPDGPESARILVQTRVPDHPVLRALGRGTPELLAADEEAMRREAGLPPFVALALVSGPLAPTYLADVRALAGSSDPARSRPPTVSELADDRFLVRAADHRALCDLLAEVPRPSGRGLRIEVDPVTL